MKPKLVRMLIAMAFIAAALTYTRQRASRWTGYERHHPDMDCCTSNITSGSILLRDSSVNESVFKRVDCYCQCAFNHIAVHNERG